MADADEKARAEKLAAAKKRVEQMKKKAKQGGGAAKKEKKEKDAPAEAPSAEDAPPPDGDESVADEVKEEEAEEPAMAVATGPSLSQQSKLRSTSFRKASISHPLSPTFQGPLSPDGDTAPDIYRKHVARIEELEKENKKLAREAVDAEKRWQKAEEELADLREADGDSAAGKTGHGGSDQIAKLKSELAALQRQNAQLQARTSTRHGSSPSVSAGSPTELEAQLQSKSATIESMELEMSRLRAQAERLSQSATASGPSEQVAALEEKLARAERAAGAAQRELADVKRSLDRASEKAVREGGERASAETKVRALEREAEAARTERDDFGHKAAALDKKVRALTTLHKEHDARTQALRRDKELADRELADARARLDAADAELLKLRKRDACDGGGTDDDHLDELEDEERRRLERRLHALEAENADLRRGIWHERRKDMQVGPDEASRFTDVDLGASPGGLRKQAGGIGDFFTALTGGGGGSAGGAAAAAAAAHHDDDFLDDEDEVEFDEEAFRRAQEEDAKARIERIREIKRALKNWDGWRLDLVENRRGGGEGIGEIFDV